MTRLDKAAVGISVLAVVISIAAVVLATAANAGDSVPAVPGEPETPFEYLISTIIEEEDLGPLWCGYQCWEDRGISQDMLWASFDQDDDDTCCTPWDQTPPKPPGGGRPTPNIIVPEVPLPAGFWLLASVLPLFLGRRK